MTTRRVLTLTCALVLLLSTAANAAKGGIRSWLFSAPM